MFLFFAILFEGGGTGAAKLMLMLFGLGIVTLIWTSFISAIRYFSKPRKEVAKEVLMKREMTKVEHYVNHQFSKILVVKLAVLLFSWLVQLFGSEDWGLE